jgi:quercetin dioxygenase-like cupin family protein
MTRKLNRAIGLVVLASVAAAGMTGAAIATSGSGVSGTVVARGLATDKVKTRGNQPYDVVVQRLVVAPGGHTGWHTHPGTAVAVVKAGTLTIYDGDDASCSPRTFDAGDTYVDRGYGHVHIGRNESTVPLEIVVTYLDVPAGGGVRIDAPSPGNCSF